MINRNFIDNQEAITLEIGNNRVTIIKSLGGTVFDLTLKGQNILFHDKPNELTKNDLFRGRLLFPFNDRIPEGKYTFEGLDLQFPLNCDGKDSIHGLIYNRELKEVSVDSSEKKDTLVLLATIKKGEFSGYPFYVEMMVTYTLTNKEFSMDFTIKNLGRNRAPFALGWHPYFTFGKKINSSFLTFSSKEYYDVDEDLYYKGDHYPVINTDYDFTKGKTIGTQELDIAISQRDIGSFALSDDNKTIVVEFSKELFPALQLFIPDDRQSIAIEPISAPSDTFNYPDTGLKVVEPKNNIHGYIKVGVSN